MNLVYNMNVDRVNEGEIGEIENFRLHNSEYAEFVLICALGRIRTCDPRLRKS